MTTDEVGAAGWTPAPAPGPARDQLEAAALAALRTARAALIGTHPMLATLALQLDLQPVWDVRVPTASVDGRRIYVRPSWLLARGAGEAAFVLAHEVLHCALDHFRRDAPGEHARWNIAMDHEVNDLLRRDGLDVPGDAVWFPELAERSAEQVYEALGREPEEAADTDGYTSQRDADAAEPEDADAEEPEDADAAPSARQRGPNADVHPSDAGPDLAAGPGPHEFDPRFRAGFDRDALDGWPARVREANRAGGAGGGVAERLNARRRESSTPWRAMLAGFVTRRLGGEARWLPPSRRHVHRGLYLPSRRDAQLNLAVAVDTSGSMVEYVGLLLGEIAAIVGAVSSHQVTVIACDVAVQETWTFSADRPLDPARLELPGGGGTDLSPPFTWLEERAARGEPIDIMVYLTDGFGPAPDHAPPWPVLWALPPFGAAPAPWGEVVRLPWPRVE